mmetsp:Transcript_14497/g.1310  ORF Transcript_14497/g.1310 Transcript_14497/m.1310 type:complete len:123 (+) Transcript_14497:376-744(+)
MSKIKENKDKILININIKITWALNLQSLLSNLLKTIINNNKLTSLIILLNSLTTLLNKGVTHNKVDTLNRVDILNKVVTHNNNLIIPLNNLITLLNSLIIPLNNLLNNNKIIIILLILYDLY